MSAPSISSQDSRANPTPDLECLGNASGRPIPAAFTLSDSTEELAPGTAVPSGSAGSSAVPPTCSAASSAVSGREGVQGGTQATSGGPSSSSDPRTARVLDVDMRLTASASTADKAHSASASRSGTAGSGVTQQHPAGRTSLPEEYRIPSMFTPSSPQGGGGGGSAASGPAGGAANPHSGGAAPPAPAPPASASASSSAAPRRRTLYDTQAKWIRHGSAAASRTSASSDEALGSQRSGGAGGGGGGAAPPPASSGPTSLGGGDDLLVQSQSADLLKPPPPPPPPPHGGDAGHRSLTFRSPSRSPRGGRRAQGAGPAPPAPPHPLRNAIFDRSPGDPLAVADFPRLLNRLLDMLIPLGTLRLYVLRARLRADPPADVCIFSTTDAPDLPEGAFLLRGFHVFSASAAPPPRPPPAEGGVGGGDGGGGGAGAPPRELALLLGSRTEVRPLSQAELPDALAAPTGGCFAEGVLAELSATAGGVARRSAERLAKQWVGRYYCNVSAVREARSLEEMARALPLLMDLVETAPEKPLREAAVRYAAEAVAFMRHASTRSGSGSISNTQRGVPPGDVGSAAGRGVAQVKQSAKQVRLALRDDTASSPARRGGVRDPESARLRAALDAELEKASRWAPRLQSVPPREAQQQPTAPRRVSPTSRGILKSRGGGGGGAGGGGVRKTAYPEGRRSADAPAEAEMLVDVSPLRLHRMATPQLDRRVAVRQQRESLDAMEQSFSRMLAEDDDTDAHQARLFEQQRRDALLRAKRRRIDDGGVSNISKTVGSIGHDLRFEYVPPLRSGQGRPRPAGSGSSSASSSAPRHVLGRGGGARWASYGDRGTGVAPPPTRGGHDVSFSQETSGLGEASDSDSLQLRGWARRGAAAPPPPSLSGRRPAARLRVGDEEEEDEGEGRQLSWGFAPQLSQESAANGFFSSQCSDASADLFGLGGGRGGGERGGSSGGGGGALDIRFGDMDDSYDGSEVVHAASARFKRKRDGRAADPHPVLGHPAARRVLKEPVRHSRLRHFEYNSDDDEELNRQLSAIARKTRASL